jgi:hypothetical protein
MLSRAQNACSSWLTRYTNVFGVARVRIRGH